MSRYVNEFAKAQMFSRKSEQRSPLAREMNEKIRRVVNMYERDFITGFEAVKSIVDIVEKYRQE